jgi:hypothetical protein
MKARFLIWLAGIAIGLGSAASAVADPRPDALLKFYQMPLNNGATPYLAPLPGSNPTGSTYGTVASTAIFPGHDELSTATRTSADPLAPWQGTFMADDFADYAGTPISHVRWWGSYIDQLQPSTAPGVRRFLISFEHNVPAGPSPTNPNVIIPSHPDVTHPGNLHQIVTLTPGIAPPAPGSFTEKLIPTPTPIGAPPIKELLYEYNAELHLGKWFNEKAAVRGENNVYWLKIVALVDAQETGPLQWGWHNRDWSIRNDLAAKPGDTPDGAERSLTAGIAGAPDLWHFEDNAVSGGVHIVPGTAAMPFMPQLVEQFNMVPENYIAPWDVPTQFHNQFSKDLAFELYTPVPEPACVALAGLAIAVLVGWRRRG